MSLGYSAPTGGYCDDCRCALGQYVETVDGDFVCIQCYNDRAKLELAEVEEGES